VRETGDILSTFDVMQIRGFALTSYKVTLFGIGFNQMRVTELNVLLIPYLHQTGYICINIEIHEKSLRQRQPPSCTGPA
jgi:hypothetical protein